MVDNMTRNRQESTEMKTIVVLAWIAFVFGLMQPHSAAQQVQRVSVSSAGAEANGPSHIGNGRDAHRVISDDGRWIVFASNASNLDSTPADTNTCPNDP